MNSYYGSLIFSEVSRYFGMHRSVDGDLAWVFLQGKFGTNKIGGWYGGECARSEGGGWAIWRVPSENLLLVIFSSASPICLFLLCMTTSTNASDR